MLPKLGGELFRTMWERGVSATPQRNLLAYQFSRTEGSSFSSPNVYKRKWYTINALSNRQHLCPGVPSTNGEDTESGNAKDSQGNLNFLLNRNISIAVEYLLSKLNTVADQESVKE